MQVLEGKICVFVVFTFSNLKIIQEKLIDPRDRVLSQTQEQQMNFKNHHRSIKALFSRSVGYFIKFYEYTFSG